MINNKGFKNIAGIVVFGSVFIIGCDKENEIQNEQTIVKKEEGDETIKRMKDGNMTIDDLNYIIRNKNWFKIVKTYTCNEQLPTERGGIMITKIETNLYFFYDDGCVHMVSYKNSRIINNGRLTADVDDVKGYFDRIPENFTINNNDGNYQSFGGVNNAVDINIRGFKKLADVSTQNNKQRTNSIKWVKNFVAKRKEEIKKEGQKIEEEWRINAEEQKKKEEEKRFAKEKKEEEERIAQRKKEEENRIVQRKKEEDNRIAEEKKEIARAKRMEEERAYEGFISERDEMPKKMEMLQAQVAQMQVVIQQNQFVLKRTPPPPASVRNQANANIKQAKENIQKGMEEYQRLTARMEEITKKISDYQTKRQKGGPNGPNGPNGDMD